MTDDVNAQLRRAAEWHERQGRRPIHARFQGARRMRELDRKEQLAFAAILARGGDPGRPRRFKGRMGLPRLLLTGSGRWVQAA